jgi:broad specificity phosphatase PhoE
VALLASSATRWYSLAVQQPVDGQHLLATLRQVPAAGPAVAVIRHAARHPIVDFGRSEDADLTVDGERAARALGKALPRERPVLLWHSPVRRCADTAALIAEGLTANGVQATVGGPSWRLGGPYIEHLPAVLRELQQRGDEGFVRAWFGDELPATVIQPLVIASTELLSEIDRRLEGADRELIILVAHDWNVMLLREGLLGQRHEDVGWPPFLDGPLLRRRDDQIEIRWRDQVALAPASRA